MNMHDRFTELWTDYLEGELDDVGMGELRELIAADEALLKLAADMYQTHHLLGLVVDSGASRQDQFVRETLSRLPEDSGSFIHRVMEGVNPPAGSPRTEPQSPAAQNRPFRPIRRRPSRSLVAIATTVVLGVVAYAVWTSPSRQQPVEITDGDAQHSLPESIAAPIEARFASLAHAKFFGELLPEVDSFLAPHRDYVLMSGLVEVAFPEGASAILEGPAVFRVLSNECLALDMGRCSIHAPDGAEGFRVETPVTRVVDRGTRFAVTVSETSATEVQVIEGAADVYQQLEPSTQHADTVQRTEPKFQVRLGSNQAQSFTNIGKFAADTVPFDSRNYQRQLPDRVISYEVTKDETGGAVDLTSVRVQRDGKVINYPVEDLIPIEVTSFTARGGLALIASNGTLPEPRRLTLSDFSLQTGFINPDGSLEPLVANPRLSVSEESDTAPTPGMGFRFKSPVINGRGPDVVFFDLQSVGYPPDGDAFHISPLQFRKGLHSHTIRVYDLTLESPEALQVATFHIHIFKAPVESLEVLESSVNASRQGGSKFRGLAVGIDLSDLGYNMGERVDGLFIQDAMDDEHKVDPVFIAGLPSSDEVQDKQP